MAGRKPTVDERKQIRELVEQGLQISELQQRFPEIDGRVISGTVLRHSIQPSEPAPSASGLPSSVPVLPPPMLPSGGNGHTPPPRDIPFVRRAALPPAAPPPLDPGIPPSVASAAAETGFSAKAQQTSTPGGFTSTRQYFIIKKIDPPGDGILGKEFPPFRVEELMDRYPAGSYEIQHFLDGRHYATYNEKVATRSPSGVPTVHSHSKEGLATTDPAAVFMRGVDFMQRFRSETEDRTAGVKTAEATVLAARENAKANVEMSQTNGLMEIVKQTLSKPEPPRPEFDRLFATMKEDRSFMERKYELDRQAAEERHDRTVALERERAKNDMERFKADLENQQKLQRDYFVQMQKLEAERRDMAQKNYEEQKESIANHAEGVNREVERNRLLQETILEMRKQNFEEIMAIRKETSGGKDIEVAKLIKDGVVGSIDRIGHRIDAIVQSKNAAILPPPAGGNGAPVSALPHTQTNEGPKMLSKDQIKESAREPWFQDLQDEIARTVKKRKTGLKLHGSMLGQTFLDQMNESPRIRLYFHFLCSRDWTEILDQTQDGLKEEHKGELYSDEAKLWFVEFQAFLIQAWNASAGVA